VTPGGVAFSNATSTYTVSGTGEIGGATALTKSGAGTVNLATSNSFTGNTTVSGGTLAVNANGALGGTGKVTINTGGTVLLGAGTTASDRISNTAEIALAGGTFSTGGFSETVGKMTLTANSTFDFGAGTSRVTFDGASSLGSSTLTVLNWTGTRASAGGTDQLLFTNSSFVAGTTTSQVQFNIGGTLYSSVFLDAGSNTLELVPIPEPGTIFGACALVLAIGWRERKRLALLRQSI
jgi:autotransporter-associated beta strand protein